MKKLFLLFGLCISMLPLSASAQQSLADVARKTRATRQANPAARVIDNDVIPSSLKAPSQPASSGNVADSDKKADAKDEKKADAKEQDKAPAESDQKKSPDLKKQMDDVKKEIAQLQREVDVNEREARLRAAAYYADAG